MSRPPLPPFTEESAAQKARAAEDAWNSREPARVSLAHAGHRIAVRFAYEYHDDSGHWFRAYGNENWQFDAEGFLRKTSAKVLNSL